jgi:transposase
MRKGADPSRPLDLCLASEARSRLLVFGPYRQTLRDWVHRFNQHGLDGLIDIKPTGRPPKLSEEQKQALKQLVEAGPDPEKDGVVRWRCVDLKRVLGQRFGVELSEVSLGRVLKKLGFSHISARPRDPIQYPEAIAAQRAAMIIDQAANCSRRALAATRSAVPKPSVNRA